MIVVDACVAMKWFIPEPMSPEADAPLQEADERVAPEHILVEVGNTLLRAFRSGGMTLEHMQRSNRSAGSFSSFRRETWYRRRC